MFTSTGLFGGIPCPKRLDCGLLNCIFSHASVSEEATSTNRPEPYDPEVLHLDQGKTEPNVRIQDEREVVPRMPQNTTLRRSAQPPQTVLSHTRTQQTGTRQDAVLQSSKRSISPPPSRKVKKARLEEPRASKIPTPECTETLRPRNAPHNPDGGYDFRLRSLKALHAAMQTLNEQARAGPAPTEAILPPAHLIKMALDLEQRIAIDQLPVYKNVVTSRLQKMRKLSVNEWVAIVTDWLSSNAAADRGVSVAQRAPSNGTSTISQPNTNSTRPPVVVTGLSSVQQELTILRLLRTDLSNLSKHGYVVKPPTSQDITKAQKAVEASAGFEKCDRCHTHFQVFPGRDPITGQLAGGGRCVYHWGKSFRAARQKTDRITGGQEQSMPCCGKPVGSEGCEENETHVFKVTDPARLAGILQFAPTPDNPRPQADLPGAVSFDCEMGYTTLGMEVIRLTAVSWPQGDDLIDVLVRPYGEILDLNTRFSGVGRDIFANALPYETNSAATTKPIDDDDDDDENTSEEGETQSNGPRIVSSPALARSLLCDFLDRNTPLLGHAIDNDLNVCRIIHPFVVDTVLLFPHPRPLPVRYSLKVLSSQHLRRGIQTGGDRGHDSREDAVATGDLVKVKVREKWERLQTDGWKFSDQGELVPAAD